MQDETHLTERSLREALEKMGMGSGKEAAAQEKGQLASSFQKRDGRGPSPARNRPGQAPARRRRFAGDDNVIVEHHSLGRSSQKRGPNRMPANAEAGQEQERLKQSLQRERRRAHDAESEIASLAERVRAANTQVTHLHLQVEEGQKAIQQRDEDILRLRAELHQLREQQRKRPTPAPKPKSVAAKDVSSHDDEPEPIQWWKD